MRTLLATLLGASIAIAAAVCPAAPIIIDDGSSTTVDPNVTLTGSWNYRPESGSGAKPHSYNGTGSRFAFHNASPTATATYTPNLPDSGVWQVDMWWPQFDWTENALVEVNHAGGTASFRVDQQASAGNFGQWNAMGVYRFDAGTGGNLVISSQGTLSGMNNVGPVADAVRFTRVGGPQPQDLAMAFQEGVSPTVSYTTGAPPSVSTRRTTTTGRPPRSSSAKTGAAGHFAVCSSSTSRRSPTLPGATGSTSKA